MGNKAVPHYADGFMARKVDPHIKQLASIFDINNQKAMHSKDKSGVPQYQWSKESYIKLGKGIQTFAIQMSM